MTVKNKKASRLYARKQFTTIFSICCHEVTLKSNNTLGIEYKSPIKKNWKKREKHL